jgi:hypothetical protein
MMSIPGICGTGELYFAISVSDLRSNIVVIPKDLSIDLPGGCHDNVIDKSRRYLPSGVIPETSPARKRYPGFVITSGSDVG